ncbi:MAG: hypothetical protein V1934_02550 [Methanobacteriota archaeon]
MTPSKESPDQSFESERLTSCAPFEFEILKLAKSQLTDGLHGGTFTPGYVRKETGKGYNAINATLAALTRFGLLERSSHASRKDDRPVEISLYKLTDAGAEALSKLESGSLKIEERAPAHPQRKNDRMPSDGEVAIIIKKLESDVAAIMKALDSLHVKIDGMQGAGAPQRPGPKRARKSDSDIHARTVLDSLRELAGNSRHALAQDVERMYGQKVEEGGLKAGSGVYFKKLIVGMEEKDLLKRKYVGCRSLGIRGHGSRLLLEITTEGLDYLAKLEGSA